MDNEDGDCTFKGIDVNVILDGVQKTPENIAYFNKQLGKYSDGNGECHVAICYECYIGFPKVHGGGAAVHNPL